MREKRPLLQQLRKYLFTCGFDTKECRVISGAEKAIYGWVAANYSLGHFSGYGLEADSTVRYVEMRGASMQIAFRPTAMEIKSYAVNNTEGETRDNLKEIRTSIEPTIAAEKENLKLNMTGILAELYPTWNQMITFIYGAGSANKAAFQAMTNVVKRV